jgi:sarcosine oxidase subunit gamma
VAELAPRDAFAGLSLPLAAGEARLAALPWVQRTAVAPFAGREEAVAAALGAALPPPNASGRRGGGRILWAGAGLWLVEGERPDLAADALATDASDAWAGLLLDGRDAREVLARLVPLDLDPAGFPPAAVARSLLRHVPLILLAAEGGFELLVPRSCAGTAVKELATAMRAVAARSALGGRPE